MKKDLIISFDDLWEGNDHWEEFEDFMKEFPSLKITFFVITGNCSEEFLQKIQRPWAQLVFHSWEHSGHWQHWSVEETKEWLQKFQKYGFEKGFKAPAYKWTENHFKACDELGFWTCSSPTVPVKTKRYWYTYPADGQIHEYHDYDEYYDHLQNKNFTESLQSLKNFCREHNPNYKFVSEMVKQQ